MIASIPMNEQNLQTEVCVSFGRAPYFLLFDTQGTARWLTNTAAESTGGAGVAAAGTDFVLLVAEPSVSGISDLQRVAKVVQNFGIPIAVCVNKSDTCPQKTQEIRDFCQKISFLLWGKSPTIPPPCGLSTPA